MIACMHALQWKGKGDGGGKDTASAEIQRTEKREQRKGGSISSFQCKR